MDDVAGQMFVVMSVCMCVCACECVSVYFRYTCVPVGSCTSGSPGLQLVSVGTPPFPPSHLGSAVPPVAVAEKHTGANPNDAPHPGKTSSRTSTKTKAVTTPQSPIP